VLCVECACSKQHQQEKCLFHTFKFV
jgi:hypothetical protein